jgi:hypothetical protein
VFYFWANECGPLPTTQDELRSIARVHQQTWQRHRDRVLKAFEDIRPELEAYYDLRETKGTNLQRLADRGNARLTQRRMLAAAERQRGGVILPTPKRTAANKAAAVEARQARRVFPSQNDGKDEIGFLY